MSILLVREYSLKKSFVMTLQPSFCHADIQQEFSWRWMFGFFVAYCFAVVHDASMNIRKAFVSRLAG
jgi:hypothetical protein